MTTLQNMLPRIPATLDSIEYYGSKSLDWAYWHIGDTKENFRSLINELNTENEKNFNECKKICDELLKERGCIIFVNGTPTFPDWYVNSLEKCKSDKQEFITEHIRPLQQKFNTIYKEWPTLG